MVARVTDVRFVLSCVFISQIKLIFFTIVVGVRVVETVNFIFEGRTGQVGGSSRPRLQIFNFSNFFKFHIFHIDTEIRVVHSTKNQKRIFDFEYFISGINLLFNLLFFSYFDFIKIYLVNHLRITLISSATHYVMSV